MEKQEIIEALKKVKADSPKRNFRQSIDLIINLKGIDLKKADQVVDVFAQLHYPKGKKVKICALVGPELLEQANGLCDKAISIDDFQRYGKKEAKKLAREYELFIAQATIMPEVAKVFGKYLGVMGKMPNPKVGGVVPPNANLKPLIEKLQKTLRLRTRNDPIVQCTVGIEDQPEEEVVDNISTAYNAVMHALPQEKNNIKNVLLKLTMGKPVETKNK